MSNRLSWSRQQYRRLFLAFIVSLIICCCLVFIIGYAIDPLWCFTHANRFNARQIRFDERQQKSDFLAVRANDYDILMLGSSRTTFLAPADIGGRRAFNFAVNAMMPDEYSDYAAFFRKHNRRPPATIVVGLDFYATNASFTGYDYLPANDYFRNAESVFWRYSVLVSRDVLLYSLKNISQTLYPTKLDFYDRHAVKTAVHIPPAARELFCSKDLDRFRRFYYGGNYRFRDLKPFYRKLLHDNPESRFILFTTPDSLALWKLLLAEGRREDYLRWIGDVVEVFGEVYDFMGETEFTADSENYMDAHHFYPEAGKTIATRIMTGAPGLPGVLVTRENIDRYAAAVRARYANLKQ